jgi:transcriptional regulator, XRE family
MGLSQDILASYLGEKVSVIKKIEAGKLKPTLDLAKKIEKLLKVNIIEEESVEETNLK